MTVLPDWNNTDLTDGERVDSLIASMTLREKLAQLYGVWVGVSPVDGEVAPFQHEMGEDVELESLLPHGLGQLTRPFGSAPVEASAGAASLARLQRRIVAANRFGIPAIAHEECLAGFTAWGATAYPVPLSWGATFDPAIVEEMSARIGASMRSVGVHQGLAPVLDVVRDPRWGRVEETIGEDPYLVGTIGSAYARGLEGSGIIATLKHFAGYSASKAGRNLAPVSMGPREYSDVMVPPFEMAVRESGVRSVMHAYTDVDGVPSAASRELLTGLLRDQWGFCGTVVADYFGVAFLKVLHGVVGTFGEAAAAALVAGVDVELPTVKTFGEPLVAELEAGRLDIEVVDGAVRRVLLQKVALGMLDPDWDPAPAGPADIGPGGLDVSADRDLARRIAEEAVVLVRNAHTLPLGPMTGKVILVVGPVADDPLCLLGCYSFPGHVGALHPDTPIGIEIPTLLDAVRAEFPDARVESLRGVTVDGTDTSGIAETVAAARSADLVIAALGDRAGLFGRGTSGEGCDAPNMKLPGMQQELLEALLDCGTDVVVTLVEGRPYALGTAPDRAAAILASFFPGEEGASAIAGVLSGRVAPSGRLPVSIPGTPDSQPATYLTSSLGLERGTSNIDQRPRYPFGHGLAYTTFEWGGLRVDGRPVGPIDPESSGPVAPAGGVGPADGVGPAGGVAPAVGFAPADGVGPVPAAQADIPFPVDGEVTVSVTIANTGTSAGVEVVQLYLHDPVASVVRPVNRLIAYARLELCPGARAEVEFTVPGDVASFTGRDGRRVVEPGALQLRLGASSGDIRLVARVEAVGEPRIVDHTRRLHCGVRTILQ